jgi:hypothetical protein
MNIQKICIEEIRKAKVGIQAWFDMLQKHCEYNKGRLCHVPLHTHPRTGMLVCKLKNCPII